MRTTDLCWCHPRPRVELQAELQAEIFRYRREDEPGKFHQTDNWLFTFDTSFNAPFDHFVIVALCKVGSCIAAKVGLKVKDFHVLTTLCFSTESSNASLLTNAEKIATITTTHTPQTIAQETK